MFAGYTDQQRYVGFNGWKLLAFGNTVGLRHFPVTSRLVFFLNRHLCLSGLSSKLEVQVTLWHAVEWISTPQRTDHGGAMLLCRRQWEGRMLLWVPEPSGLHCRSITNRNLDSSGSAAPRFRPAPKFSFYLLLSCRFSASSVRDKQTNRLRYSAKAQRSAPRRSAPVPPRPELKSVTDKDIPRKLSAMHHAKRRREDLDAPRRALRVDRVFRISPLYNEGEQRHGNSRNALDR